MRSKYFTKQMARDLVAAYPGLPLEDLLTKAWGRCTPSVTNQSRFARTARKKLEDALASASASVDDPPDCGQEEPVVGGTLEAPDERRLKASGSTFVFTCAQNNTLLNEEFFDALVAYCEARDAQLHISRFTYNKAAYSRNSVKPGSKKATDQEDIWFDPKIEPYVSDEPLEITSDLIWCGELNVLPTRINPLSSFKGYTRQASGIIPHAKMAMESVPTMKNDPAKFLYTTGTVTQRNYIQKASGQVADFHHVFGAIVVEVDEDNNWWARQLNADKSGGFNDLDGYWTKDGPDAARHSVRAITHGDIHWTKVDRSVLDVVFQTGGVLDSLSPAEQFFHDTIDFTARNHHNIRDPHFLHEMYVKGTDRVEREFEEVANFLSFDAHRPWCQSVIVVSNHDQAIETWLRNTTAALDPVNAGFWHSLNAQVYSVREQGGTPRPFKYAMRKHLNRSRRAGFKWVQEDESYRILDEIECGLHGHLGPNGARGNPKNLRTVGKANTAHTHSAGIIEGVYTAGVYGKLDMGYNKGLSSWSHSLIVTYKNAKRTILTIKGGKAWRDQ